MRTFKEFDLEEVLLRNLRNNRFELLYEIQAIVIPKILKQDSLVFLSPVASGKTLAYAVPLINQALRNRELKVLLLFPTVELLNQTMKVFQVLLKDTNLRLINLFNDSNYETGGFFFGTPEKAKKMVPESFDTIVMDEVDFMVQDGFLDDLKTILQKPFKQYIFLSATIPEEVFVLLKKLTHVNLKRVVQKKTIGFTISRYLVNLKHQKRSEVLKTLLKQEHFYKTVIFVSDLKQLKLLAQSLQELDFKFFMIHSDLPLNERKNQLDRILKGEFDLVLVSDALSRGIDFSEVTNVISYDFPRNLAFVEHRLGRTGRHLDGSFYQFYDDEDLKRIERLKDYHTYVLLEYKSNGTFLKKTHRVFKNKPHDPRLQAALKKIAQQRPVKKVRPNYKKKIQKQKERVIKNYRDKMIKDKIRQSKQKEK
ncbi:MAG: DEAD/DEAH box helicase [Erysipelotrichaceae bacterium]|nr:DEAD/DEAH box helicase [Erysipelotrichaceae bacterium]